MFENVKKILDFSQSTGIPGMDIRIFHEGEEAFEESLWKGVGSTLA